MHCFMKKMRKAFTLVELMIIVAIIGILVAVSVPVLLRSRMNANHNVAKSNVRLIRDAIEAYRMSQTPLTYPADLPMLASLNPFLLDSQLANATSAPGKQGYYFTYAPSGTSQYTLVATPDSSGVTGTEVYFVDESGIVRHTNANGPPVQ